MAVTLYTTFSSNRAINTLMFNTALSRLLECMSYASLGLRKYIVACCRTQVDPRINRALTMEAHDIDDLEKNVIVIARTGSFLYSFSQICIDLTEVFKDPLATALVGYYARAERPHAVSEFLEQKGLASMKELRASLLPDRPQQLNYASLFGGDNVPISPYVERSGLLTQLWKRGLDLAKSKLFENRLFYPHYNVHKNVSHATCSEYTNLTASDPSDYSITTWNLLELYARTGHATSGPCEMRTSWKLNDLKPRTYYCIGGDLYFASLYIKDICTIIQEILPCTNPYTRFDVNRLTVTSLAPEEFIITYDYTSFTTSLAELKYFLTDLSRALEGVTIRVLDLYQGIREIDLGEYIADYNKSVNMNAEFSIHRLLDPLEPGCSADTRSTMNRNGPLGVGGNIGFSTVNHGISMSAFSGRPDRDSCVGDDALLRILQMQFSNFVSHTNLLGEINPSKFTTFLADPYQQDLSNLQGYRYLKRPLTVDYLGYISQGELLTIPSLAEVLHELDPDTTRDVMDHDRATLQKTFATQTARFLQRARTLITSYDMIQIYLHILKKAYSIIGLPAEGALPGVLRHTYRFNQETGKTEQSSQFSDIFVPPLVEEVFESDWSHILCLYNCGETIRVSTRTSSRYTEPFQGLGSQVVMPSNPGLDILRLMEIVDVEMNFEYRTVGVSLFPEDIESLMYGSGVPVYTYTLLKDLPPWYLDIEDELICI